MSGGDPLNPPSLTKTQKKKKKEGGFDGIKRLQQTGGTSLICANGPNITNSISRMVLF
jgi:hypothetical protein